MAAASRRRLELNRPALKLPQEHAAVEKLVRTLCAHSHPAWSSPQPPEQPVPIPKPSLPDDPGLTPGLLLTTPREGREDEANCSREAQKARLVDCEYQCGRNLQVMTCLTAFRS